MGDRTIRRLFKALIAGQPTYGYRRIHALLRRQRREQGGTTVNVKRVYRVMKTHGLKVLRLFKVTSGL